MITNTGWWAPPKTTAVYWLIVPSIDTQIGMLEAGQSDMTAASLTPSQAKRLTQNKDIGSENAPTHAPREIRFNLELAPFDDVVARKALSLATDRKRIVATLSDGAATPGNDAYISPKLSWSNKSLPIPEFSLEKARALLAEAGYTWDSDGRIRYPSK